MRFGQKRQKVFSGWINSDTLIRYPEVLAVISDYYQIIHKCENIGYQQPLLKITAILVFKDNSLYPSEELLTKGEYRQNDVGDATVYIIPSLLKLKAGR